MKIKIALFKDKKTKNMMVREEIFEKYDNFERISEWFEYEPDIIEDLPYYMADQYQFINIKEFGLRDMWQAWNNGALSHLKRPHSTTNFDYFLMVAKKRGWIDEERI